MTNVSFVKIHESYFFECTGHTQYATPGRDILCSAVSILCYTLGDYIEKLYSEGSITNYSSDFSDGSVRITFSFTDKATEAFALHTANAILRGFCLLSESFPDHVSADM